MGLAAQTSLKASKCISAAFVANRVALWEIVLNKIDAHENFGFFLRESSFASKELFGPLPCSLKDKLTALNGKRFIFTPRSTPQPSQNQASDLGSTGLCHIQRGSGPCLKTFLLKLLARKIVRGLYFAPSAPLFQTLPGLQEGRNIPPCPRALSAEQIPGCPSLQDGFHPVNRYGHSGALMGLHSGSGGCLLPSAHWLAVPLLPDLPFVLVLAPWAFNQATNPVKIHLHLCSILGHSYLDDLFILQS